MRAAIIPARGGSKRVPGKNIRPINGLPLIAWSIRACAESGLFDRVLVSTDSPEIAAIAREYGAETPFLRPAGLADDFTPTKPVVDHAVAWIDRHWGAMETYCQLYANPFVSASGLREAFDLLTLHRADEVLAVTAFPYPILRAFRRAENGGVEYAFPEYAASRSQDLPEFFHDAGQFYWHGPGKPGRERLVLPFFIPGTQAVDIDTEDDWRMAERLHALFLEQRRTGEREQPCL